MFFTLDFTLEPSSSSATADRCSTANSSSFETKKTHSSRKKMPITVVPRLQLSDGNSVPILGFGTYSIGDYVKTKNVVKYAIELGYRHLDCAMIYGNEKAIGEAIREAIQQGIVQRSDLFVTTKCWNTYHEKHRVLECCRKSLNDLGLDYVDLYLIHWPMGFKETQQVFPTSKEAFSAVDYLETWEGMEECKARGYTRSIGMSNFNSQQIDRVLSVAKIRPVMNQVECHPYLNQKKLHEFCKSRGIALTAYSPLGSPGSSSSKLPEAPKIIEEPRIKAVAQRIGKTVAQVLLRYQVQRGIVVIPKSATKSRIKENIDIFSFQLSEEDMNIIDSCNCGIRYIHFTEVKDHPFYPFHLAF